MDGSAFIGASFEGCAVKIAGRIEDQVPARVESVRFFVTEAVQYLLGPPAVRGRRQLEHSTTLVRAPAIGCAIEIAGLVEYHAAKGPMSVPRIPKFVQHGFLLRDRERARH